MKTRHPFSGIDELARRSLLAIPLAIILFLALNAIVGVIGRAQRIDLTADSRFTVSAATRKTLASIDEPVTLRLYRSPALIDAAPVLKIYADRVDEMLRSYRTISGGKVQYEVIEPQPFSVDEDQAIAFRLHGFNVDRSGAQGYFGLVGSNRLDGLERIEFLDPAREESLEYDLTSLVKKLAQPHRLHIGLIDSLNMGGSRDMGRPPWAIVNILNESYEVKSLTGPERSFDGVDLLMIVHPRGLEPLDLYSIDQFALSGKPVLAFVDPVAESLLSQSQRPLPPEAVSSGLDPLLAAWGVDLPAGKVVGDRTMALRVTAMAGRQRVLAPYPPWLQVREANFNHDDMATSRLKLMRVSSAGTLAPLPDATTKFSPLISTTNDSMLLDAAQVVQRLNPNVFLEAFKPGGKPIAIAARISGPAVSAYPGGPPATEKPMPPPFAKGDIHLVVVADSDVLANDHVIDGNGELISNNADFVLNVVDTLAGGADLASLRGRAVAPRPFTRIEALEQDAEALYRARENALTTDLEKSQQDLQDMLTRSGATGGDAATLTREQQALLDQLNQKIVDLRRQLRDVRASLRLEIDRLETNLKLLNMLAIPVLLVLAGLFSALWRRMRLARYIASRANHRGSAG